MAFRKFSAPRIHDGHRFVRGAKTIIANESGRIIDLVDSRDAGDDIQWIEGILSPAFINCHVHLELSHMKGLVPERTGLVQFVIEVVSKRHFPEEVIHAAIEAAEKEMLQNGIIAAGDICNNLSTIKQKIRKNLRYHNFIEASGYPPSIAEGRFRRASELFLQFQKISPSSIVPHAPYSVSAELFEMILGMAGNEVQSMHNQETAGENEWFESGSGALSVLYDQMKIDTAFHRPPGTSSLRSVAPKFRSNQQVILVHNVHTKPADVQFTRKSAARFFWCLCPLANWYIEGALPNVPMLVDEGCELVLGTDSLASNHRLDLISEMRALRKAFPGLEEEMMLKWATSNGAKALRMEDELGSIGKGKTPGLVAVDDAFMKATRVL